MGVEWAPVQHLDLRHVGRGLKPLQPHSATFHPTQAIVAVPIGSYIIEFDALTGSKICSVNIGAHAVRMSYSPTSGHTVIAILEEIMRLQKVHGTSALGAKDEMARLSRHLGSLPLLAKHRINCIRTAIKRNMEVQNFAYAKQMLELLYSKAPPGKQDELRSLIDMCELLGFEKSH